MFWFYHFIYIDVFSFLKITSSIILKPVEKCWPLSQQWLKLSSCLFLNARHKLWTSTFCGRASTLELRTLRWLTHTIPHTAVHGSTSTSFTAERCQRCTCFRQLLLFPYLLSADRSQSKGSESWGMTLTCSNISALDILSYLLSSINEGPNCCWPENTVNGLTARIGHWRKKAFRSRRTGGGGVISPFQGIFSLFFLGPMPRFVKQLLSKICSKWMKINCQQAIFKTTFCPVVFRVLPPVKKHHTQVYLEMCTDSDQEGHWACA